MSRDSALWIGGVSHFTYIIFKTISLMHISQLEKYMTEDFLNNAFELMGEESIVSIKVIKNKFTGEPAPYGFVHFDSDAAALMVMHKLNNKIIPHSQPPVRFQLNHASAKHSQRQFTDREYSIWVSDLPLDITDEEFSKAFSSRFESLKTAKLFKEEGKVYGFVRFRDLNDQRDALIHMNGFYGLGKKPIKVTLAIPKRSLAEATNKINTTYSDMYESYWSDPGALANYGEFQSSGRAILVSSNAAANSTDFDFFDNGDSEDEDRDAKDEERLIDHSAPINVDAMNTEFISRSTEVWDQMEADRWIYNLENEHGILPDIKRKKKSTFQTIEIDEEEEDT